MKRALVLSSGGIDSTTCLIKAIQDVGKESTVAVSIFYGQKHSKELQCAKNIGNYYNIKHIDLNLSEVLKYSNCSLIKGSSQEIKHSSYEEQIKEDGIVNSYVPFRNGLMLSAVASLALSLYPEDEIDIYLGAHADDYAGNAYADTSPEFSNAMYSAIKIGTYNKVNVVTPFINMNKSQVIKFGLENNVPYNMTWSCYEGNNEPCGECGTCKDCIKGFNDNNINYLSLFN